jgi:glycosyltransferase involved in cell wall biosynthesis
VRKSASSEFSLSLVSWAYNEEDLVDEFVKKADSLLKKTVTDYEIVIVDDGSTDKTTERLAALKKRFNRLRVLKNSRNRNVGYSCRRAIKAASKQIVFWQTVDWSYDIRTIRDNLKYLKSYDVLAGVRRKPVDARGLPMQILEGVLKLFSINHLTKRSDTIWKAIVSAINYCLIRALFQVPLSDFQNIVFYRRSFIQQTSMEAKSSFVNPELLLKAHWSGLAIKEIPVNFIPRKKGSAKGTKAGSILASVRDIIFFWYKWKISGSFRILVHGKINRIH